MCVKDDPIIRAMESRGYVRAERTPICPVCGEECGEYVKDKDGRIVGCPDCVKTVSAWEEDDE